jgi:hypothetical protein
VASKGYRTERARTSQNEPRTTPEPWRQIWPADRQRRFYGPAWTPGEGRVVSVSVRMGTIFRARGSHLSGCGAIRLIARRDRQCLGSLPSRRVEQEP